jgi:ABC-type transport system involved in multi-copper enzyme maturation permease subunit
VSQIKQALRLRLNPIMVKELRSRMRGARAFIILTGVLLLLAGVSYLFYRIVLETTRSSNQPVGPQIGYTLLVVLTVVEMLIVCFITPAITSGMISGEKEKLTYEMLLATPMRPAGILLGKLLSALGYVFLLLLASVPMASLVFVFGGITLADMVKVMLVLGSTAVMLGVFGITVSAWLGRTVRATVLGYFFVLLLTIGPYVLWIVAAVARNEVPPSWILVLNPISALLSALTPSNAQGSSSVLFEVGRLLGGGAVSVGETKGLLPRPLFHYTLPAYGLISLVLYLLATRLVRPARRWRIRWREAAWALVALLALAGAVAVPFLVTAGRYEQSTFPTPTPVPAIVPAVPRIIGPLEPERAVPQVIEVAPSIDSAVP